MEDVKLYVGLDPRPNNLYTAVIEPGFGQTVEAFFVPWHSASHTLGEALLSWQPFYAQPEISVAICPEDACWPPGFTEYLHRVYDVHMFQYDHVDDILGRVTRLLSRKLVSRRAELIAFLNRHRTIANDPFFDLSPTDLACAWALLLSRQQLLDVHTAIALGGHDLTAIFPLDPLNTAARYGPRDESLVPTVATAEQNEDIPF